MTQIAPTHLALADLEAALPEIRQAPADAGTVDLIVRRPAVDGREPVDAATLDVRLGLLGDNWHSRGSSRTADGSANPLQQLTLMGTRAIAAIAPDAACWPLAGDQFFVDLDLSLDNLPPGSRLAIGDAVIEVSPQPHTGCKKFAARFGVDAVKFVSTPLGRRLNLRGINAFVVQGGAVRAGDAIRVTRRGTPS